MFHRLFNKRFHVAECLFSCRSQMRSNVIRTNEWHTKHSLVCHWCSYRILMSLWSITVLTHNSMESKKENVINGKIKQEWKKFHFGIMFQEGVKFFWPFRIQSYLTLIPWSRERQFFLFFPRLERKQRTLLTLYTSGCLYIGRPWIILTRLIV